jgi:hypothetical protein
MVELQPSKLIAWVRFPSPAHKITEARSKDLACCIATSRLHANRINTLWRMNTMAYSKSSWNASILNEKFRFMRLCSCIIVIFLTGMISCMSLFNRKGPSSSAIGINVYLKSGGYLTPLKHVFFVRVNPKQGDIYSQKDFIRSNLKYDKYIYLLNAQPGRYIAIGAYREERDGDPKDRSTSRKKKNYFFPKNMIPLTVIDLGPAEFRYMGTYIIKHRGEPRLKEFYRIRKADSVQLHYCKLIDPDHVNPTAGSYTRSCLSDVLWSASTGDDRDDEELSYAGKLIRHNRGKTEEKQFLRESSEHLSGTDWIPLIKKRLREL